MGRIQSIQHRLQELSGKWRLGTLCHPVRLISIEALRRDCMCFHFRMLSKVFYKLLDGWNSVFEVQGVPTVLPGSMLEEHESLKNRIAVNVHIHRLTAAEEFTPVQIHLGERL